MKKEEKFAPDWEGSTALHLAAGSAWSENSVEMLLKDWPKEKLDLLNKEKRSALRHAVAEGRSLKKTKELLAAGAAADLGDKAGWTPLMMAAMRESEDGAKTTAEMVKILMEKGNQKAKDKWGRTALNFAPNSAMNTRNFERADVLVEIFSDDEAIAELDKFIDDFEEQEGATREHVEGMNTVAG